MKVARFPNMALALAVFAGGFTATSSSADDGHEHPASHEHATVLKAEKKISAALSGLTPEDKKLAMSQRFCPIRTHDRLGAMGTPQKLTIEGKPVFVCCKGCVDKAVAGGAATVKTVAKLRDSTHTLAKLPMAERKAIEAQKYCAVASHSLLGAMGEPIKLEIDGTPVYLCCSGCTNRAQSNPVATLAKVKELNTAGTRNGRDQDHADHKH